MYNVHIHSLHAGAQWVSRSDRVCALQVDICIHVSTCMYVHTWTYACTMYIYILYMQVLNECLAVKEFVSCRLTSVYMYLRACTVCMHTHGRMHVQCTYTFFTCRCSMGVSQLVGVLRRLYTSTCIYSCVVCSCMHTHGHINVHSLHAGVQWVSRGFSDRIGVLQHPYTYTYLQDSCSHSK